MPQTAATTCPLCGQRNQCAMEIEKATGQKQAPCWCTQLSFNAELLAQIPPESINKACLCAVCANSQGQHPLRISA